MEIRIVEKWNGTGSIIASFRKNKKYYVQEAIGLAIFMISACFFGGMLESKNGALHTFIHNPFLRRILMSICMGATALFIFYSPFTSPSGAHINPAVTISFLRLNKMCLWDALFYIIFQFFGGTIAVYLIAALMGDALKSAPVNYVVTIPGKYGVVPAAITELIIAFIMMLMVLFTSQNARLKKYTRVIAAIFVSAYVFIAGPISGFGMNPARSFASALPANTWTGFWIYLFVPFLGMLAATEIDLLIRKRTFPGIKFLTDNKME